MKASRAIVFVSTLAATAAVLWVAIPRMPTLPRAVANMEAPTSQPGAPATLKVGDRELSVHLIATPALLTHAARRPPVPTDQSAVLLAMPMEMPLALQGGGLESPVDVAFIDIDGEIDSVGPLAAGPLGEVRSRDSAMFALLLPYKKAESLGLKARGTVELPDMKSLPIDVPSLPTVRMTLGGVEHTLEVADDGAETMVGLMYRNSMPQNHGMLFVFPREQPLGFYMRNTRIPLDIIYIAESGELVSVVTLKPFDETSAPSKGPARYVVELNAGEAARLGLKEGDKLSLPDVSKQTSTDKN
jgi:uncharacterized protein